jgi:hypothetical protein
MQTDVECAANVDIHFMCSAQYYEIIEETFNVLRSVLYKQTGLPNYS